MPKDLSNLQGFKWNGIPGGKSKIEATTDNALEWFPELEQVFKNFNISKLQFTVANREKTSFVIIDPSKTL